MDRDSFVREMDTYSIPDLELICRTQKDVYTAEEMQLIEEVLESKKQQKKKAGSDIRFGETLFCIVALLTPISGAVAGIIMLAAGSSEWKQAGKRTLIAAFVSILIRLFLYSGGFAV